MIESGTTIESKPSASARWANGEYNDGSIIGSAYEKRMATFYPTRSPRAVVAEISRRAGAARCDSVR